MIKCSKTSYILNNEKLINKLNEKSELMLRKCLSLKYVEVNSVPLKFLFL